MSRSSLLAVEKACFPIVALGAGVQRDRDPLAGHLGGLQTIQGGMKGLELSELVEHRGDDGMDHVLGDLVGADDRRRDTDDDRTRELRRRLQGADVVPAVQRIRQPGPDAGAR